MRFLFTTLDFATGGVTGSLRNLTSALVSEGHEVMIFCLSGQHDNDGIFDSRVSISYPNKYVTRWRKGLRDFHTAKGIKKIKLFFFGILKKCVGRLGLHEKVAYAFLPDFECDVAIAFRQSNALNYIVARKTVARRRIAFIHSEIDANIGGWMRYLDEMDYITCVSDDWSTKFRELYPNLQKKVRTVYNIFDPEKIISQANEEQAFFNQNVFNIVTVSRIDTPPKNIEWIPIITEQLRKKGMKIHWTIVGDGPSRELVEQNIRITRTSDNITLAGVRTNPYPFIKGADLFVLLSSRESYGMVLMESLILGTPIVTTAYPAAYEIVADNSTGIICGISEKAIEKAISDIVQNHDLYERLKRNCKAYKYDRSQYLNRFLELCD